MTLTDLVQIIKTRWVLLTLFLGVVGLIILILFRGIPGPSKPTLPPIPIATYSASTKPASFDFSSLPKIEYPKQLSAYTIEVQKFTKKQATDLAVKLGFGPDPAQTVENTTTGTLYAWHDATRSLDVSEQIARYTLFSGGFTGLQLVTDEKTTQNTAIKFLKETGLATGLTINPTYTSYFKVEGGQLTPVGKQEANIVQFSLQRVLGNYPLVGQNPILDQVIRVDGSGKIVSFQVKPAVTYDEIAKYPLKTKNSATKEISGGQGVITTATKVLGGGLLEITEQPGFQLSKGTIKNVYLAYYYPIPAPDTLQPIFVFEGDFVDKKGQEGQLTIYLPAIEGQVGR